MSKKMSGFFNMQHTRLRIEKYYFLENKIKFKMMMLIMNVVGIRKSRLVGYIPGFKLGPDSRVK